MGEVSAIGLEIAKSVFQLHGVDVAGSVVIRKRVSRAKVLEYFGGLPRCLVGIKACPSAHHWGRELQAVPVVKRNRLAVGGNRTILRLMLDLLRLFLGLTADLFRSRASLEAEVLALRQQINVLQRLRPKRPTLSSLDRLVLGWICTMRFGFEPTGWTAKSGSPLHVATSIGSF